MAIDWADQRYQEMEQKAFATNYSVLSAELEWECQEDDAYHYSISKRLDRFIDEHEYRENLIA